MIADPIKSATPRQKVVIRNYAFLSFSIFGAIFCFAAALLRLPFRDPAPQLFSTLFFGLAAVYIYGVFMEMRGVVINDDFVGYPVRFIADSFLPIFRKKVAVRDVFSASCLRCSDGRFIVYLTGDFGEARILMENKGNRDRFFAVFMNRFPKIRIFRWR